MTANLNQVNKAQFKSPQLESYAIGSYEFRLGLQVTKSIFFNTFVLLSAKGSPSLYEVHLNSNFDRPYRNPSQERLVSKSVPQLTHDKLSWVNPINTFARNLELHLNHVNDKLIVAFSRLSCGPMSRCTHPPRSVI
uniref:Uncharacterized protein n=1 Tax=Opuntia streptacantha TaxID=393608 RepID=A0A7C8ZM99_OPUST